MNILETKAYQKAFIRYLRKGTPIDLSLRAFKEATRRYIWRTAGDGKVRPSHAVNAGKIFSTDNPPTTGNPGEDFNCRCWAEPMDGEYVEQTLISTTNDNSHKWTTPDFVRHYKRGNGRGVTLSEIGRLGDIIAYYRDHHEAFNKVNKQIIDQVRTQGEGDLMYNFENTYEFGTMLTGVSYSFGDSTVYGLFNGTVRQEKHYLVVNGLVTYQFHDEFTDPFELVEMIDYIPGYSREDSQETVGDVADTEGIPYKISGDWITKFNATIIRVDE